MSEQPEDIEEQEEQEEEQQEEAPDAESSPSTPPPRTVVYSCNECGGIFPTIEELDHHEKTVH